MTLSILPTESVGRICSYLEPCDLSSLRLSCNNLLHKSLNAFGDSHFKTIRMIITSDSLRKLQEIAVHACFRTFVRQLIILPVLFEDDRPTSYISFSRSSFGVFSWPRRKMDDSELEYRYKTYQAILADHQESLNSLEEILTNCLPQFSNLDAFSLQPESTDALPGIKEISFPGCLGLSQFRRQMDCHSNRPTHSNLAHNPDISKVGSHVLSALLKAIIASNRKIRELFTCQAIHCGVSLSSMKLSLTEYASLLPLIRGAECLHLCPRGAGQDKPHSEAFIEFVVSSSTNLNMLNITDKGDSDGSMFQYFPQLASNVHFTRLQELHIALIEISLNDFKSFLRSATSTLKILNMEFVTLNDDFQSESPEERKDETRKLWLSAWNFLRDESSLQFLSMRGLAHRGIELRVIDRLAHSSGRSTSDDSIKPGTIAFDGKDAQISFCEWIDGLELRPFSKIRPNSAHQPSNVIACTWSSPRRRRMGQRRPNEGENTAGTPDPGLQK